MKLTELDPWVLVAALACLAINAVALWWAVIRRPAWQARPRRRRGPRGFDVVPVGDGTKRARGRQSAGSEESPFAGD